MKFSLANIDAYTPPKVPVTVEMVDPHNWEDVNKIAQDIHDKLVERIRIAKADEAEWKVEHISCSPQADDSKGRVFFVHADMYVMLTPKFKGDVWHCTRMVVGNELDKD